MALFREALRGSMRNFSRLRGFGFLLVVGGLLVMSAEAGAQDRGQTRSMVISKGGIVASESPLASPTRSQHVSRLWKAKSPPAWDWAGERPPVRRSPS